MEKQIVNTINASQPKGPYSQGVVYNDTLYVSGMGPIDPKTQSFVLGTIEEEARATLSNIKAIVEAAGFSMDNALMVSVYLADINDFGKFNAVYGEFFSTPFPARSCVQVGQLGWKIKCGVKAIIGK